MSNRAKFNELFIEFTRYLIEHPEFAECIPEDAQVVLLDRQDPVYSRQAIEFSGRASGTDDVADRPIVYIKVTQMAPVRSRVRDPRPGSYAHVRCRLKSAP